MSKRESPVFPSDAPPNDVGCSWNALSVDDESDERDTEKGEMKSLHSTLSLLGNNMSQKMGTRPSFCLHVVIYDLK